MKKLIFIIICFFSSMSLVKASNLESINLPYYVKINNKVINVKKIYDKDTLQVVFNLDYENYNTSNEFNVNKEVNAKNYGKFYQKIDIFNDFVYYGYTTNPSDLNYFITQIILWSFIGKNEVIITDSLGNKINDYDENYTIIFNKSLDHNANSEFINETYTKEIWDTSNYNYIDCPVLDNPSIDGLKFENYKNKLQVYAEKIGDYEINLKKEYEQENYSYSDGVNYYWQSLKGPSNIYKKFYYQVYGNKLKINENITSINGKFGDAVLTKGIYELYLNDELKLIIDDLNKEYYVKSNSSYKLKNINKDVGTIDEEIKFNVFKDDYELTIEKKVISKKIKLNILDNKKYYIYLKSNDELYEIVDKDSKEIVLPYGLYYIKDENNLFYYEIEITNEIEEEILVGYTKVELTENNKEEKEIIIEKLASEELEENIIHTSNDNNVEVTNPKTLDNIYINIFISILTIAYFIRIKKVF